MKNVITISLILFSFLGYSQKKYKRADDFFDKMWYIEAAKEYEAAIEKGDKSKEVLQKAGDAYYFNTNMEGAHKWYDLLVSEYPDAIEAEYLFRYAHTFQGIDDNRSAKKWMKKFSQKANAKDPRAQLYSQDKISLEDVLDLEPQFTLKNLEINTKFSDFGPMYFQDLLVYSSAVDTSNYHTRNYHWNEQPFLNLLLGEVNTSQTDVIFLEEFSRELNTKYHEATVAFSPDQKTIYFTRNNYNGSLERDDNGINHLKLYSAKIIVGGEKIEWTEVKELPFNSNDYSVGHPTVSKDGTKLYFVSDMPGSIGATDIFVVDIIGEDTYSQPRNLGPTINTYGREMFPYITDKALYFASDGHLGLGGLDVFESKHDYTFNTPINLGAPLNSNLDDFGYIVNENTNKGYVCSNRKTGKGDDDIYSFERTPIEKCQQTINGRVTNSSTKDPISEAKLVLLSENGEIVAETQSQLNGDYSFNYKADCRTSYQIKTEKIGYKLNTTPLKTNNNTGEINVPITLSTVNKLIVEEGGVLKIKIGIIYFDINKSVIRNDAASELNKVVLLMKEYPKMIIKIESHTDSRSNNDYNLKLSDKRAKATREYIISQNIEAERIESAIGYGESKLINECEDDIPCSEVRHQLNRRSEFIIIKM
ncbi:flagellar motor protein MotB [Aquimarina aggregata]|uniref:Flagellar motor protein MotB n=1 Tax=Aquimarina aggregata TaxID=1642818 RepID=A0A162ZW30_9FLAO|nr:OmpA family protein [Aquimarina aggregata]KZS40078.1 flagellar motor protein MotB [Aquimarina aggregata]